MSRPEAARDWRPASMFAALGDQTRLSLLSKLSGGERQSIASLSVGSAMTRQAITKHLRVLENAGLVNSAKIGRESLFALTPEPIAALRTYLDGVSRQWDQALSRLRLLVERESD